MALRLPSRPEAPISAEGADGSLRVTPARSLGKNAKGIADTARIFGHCAEAKHDSVARQWREAVSKIDLRLASVTGGPDVLRCLCKSLKTAPDLAYKTRTSGVDRGQQVRDDEYELRGTCTMATPERRTTIELGNLVRRHRQQRGLPLRALATAAGVDPTWILRLERGEYHSPDPRNLAALARALEIDVADLYQAAGYEAGRELPGFEPYLRSKYDLPPEAVAELRAHFDAINEAYLRRRPGDRS